MLRNSRGKQLWIVEETGARTPVRTPGDISRRPRGRGKPDWWVEERDPDWTPEEPVSLLRLGMTQNDAAASKTSPRLPKDEFGGGFESGEPGGAGHGTGMKIGAGHKPQAYDARGRYTGPGGGSISMRDGSIRMLSAADEDGGDESRDGEPDAGTEAPEELAEELAEGLEDAAQALEAAQEQAREGYQGLEGVLIADSGRIRSDAGGLSGGYEVRGPLQQREDQAERYPATMTWKNSEERHGLKPHMHDTIESMRQDVPKLDSVFVSSGRREPLGPGDPHADGRGLDISRVNGHPVSGLETSTAPGADRAREAAVNLEEWARNNEDVNQIIGPNGGWEKREGNWRKIPPTDPRVQGHQNHYHINVRR